MGQFWRQIALQRNPSRLVGFRRICALLYSYYILLVVVVTAYLEFVSFTKFGRRCRWFSV